MNYVPFLMFSVRSIADKIHSYTAESLMCYRSLNATGKVDHRHVGSGNTESHSSQFSVEAGNNFSHGLGGSSGRRDDVSAGRSTTAPVLVARPVDRLLCGRVRVHGRHQTLDDVVLLVDDFGQRRQTVGRARRVAARHTVKV